MPRYNFRRLYSDLVRRHVGRAPRTSDGFSEAAVARAEKRLGLRLPLAVREYYLVIGRIKRLNREYNRLFTPKELRVEDGYLVFMEENQAVVHWGIPLRRLESSDPVVWQRVNSPQPQWYSEEKRFSAFIVAMHEWIAGFINAAD